MKKRIFSLLFLITITINLFGYEKINGILFTYYDSIIHTVDTLQPKDCSKYEFRVSLIGKILLLDTAKIDIIRKICPKTVEIYKEMEKEITPDRISYISLPSKNINIKDFFTSPDLEKIILTNTIGYDTHYDKKTIYYVYIRNENKAICVIGAGYSYKSFVTWTFFYRITIKDDVMKIELIDASTA